MEENNNVSKFEVTVGTFDESDNCPKLHLCIDVNKEIA